MTSVSYDARSAKVAWSTTTKSNIPPTTLGDFLVLTETYKRVSIAEKKQTLILDRDPIIGLKPSEKYHNNTVINLEAYNETPGSFLLEPNPRINPVWKW